MTSPYDIEGLTYGDGVYADPDKLTDLVRFYGNQNSRAVATNIVAKSAPGLLFGFSVSSIGAQFIQGFDASSLPADGTVPTFVFPVAATNQVSAQWMPPRSFRNGLVLCASSTQHTKTIAVAADCIFDVQAI